MRDDSGAKYPHIFGPVSSRRLGQSVGIDIIPFKTCSLDCLYCECGRTTELTTDQNCYVTSELILNELEEFLKGNPNIDVLTFAGSGEPTLNSELGLMISAIKSRWPEYKISVLTNGTFLTDPKVRSAILKADYVLPSLDAVSEDIFQKLNRPAKGVSANDVVEGIQLFSQEYKGILWIEVFIIPGINDTEEELKKIKNALSKINLTSVQLNTLDRPGTSKDIEPANIKRLKEIAKYFSDLPKVEIISRQTNPDSSTDSNDLNLGTLLATIARRPLTIEDISSLTGRTIPYLKVQIESLINDKRIESEEISGQIFYKKID